MVIHIDLLFRVQLGAFQTTAICCSGFTHAQSCSAGQGPSQPGQAIPCLPFCPIRNGGYLQYVWTTFMLSKLPHCDRTTGGKGVEQADLQRLHGPIRDWHEDLERGIVGGVEWHTQYCRHLVDHELGGPVDGPWEPVIPTRTVYPAQIQLLHVIVCEESFS